MQTVRETYFFGCKFGIRTFKNSHWRLKITKIQKPSRPHGGLIYVLLYCDLCSASYIPCPVATTLWYRWPLGLDKNASVNILAKSAQISYFFKNREEISFDPKKNLHGKNQRVSLKNSSPYSKSKMFNV